MRFCKPCGTEHNDDSFYTITRSSGVVNKVCKITSNAHTKKLREASQSKNSERLRAWRLSNPDKTRKQNREYTESRKKIDPKFRLLRYLRSRTSRILTKNKAGSFVRDLGCTKEELMVHLELQFVTGMHWDNYGKWVVDHIKPLCSFDLSIREQFLEAAHYTNLRPYWKEDNSAKISSDKKVSIRNKKL